jgi:DNA-binding transcriptional MerR regulator
LNKAPDAFRTISEVADELDLPQHVLRFWESRFPHVRPMKRGGGRRYYRPEDVDLLRGIRHLLYGDGYTIRGVQRILREQGVRTVQSVGQGRAAHLPLPPPDAAHDADGEVNGARGKFPSPMGVSDETEDEIGDLERSEPVLSESAFENRRAADANSGPAAVPPAPEPTQAGHASLLVAAPPPPGGLAAEDLDRLQHALAELEACRRLLDKANEGG